MEGNDLLADLDSVPGGARSRADRVPPRSARSSRAGLRRAPDHPPGRGAAGRGGPATGGPAQGNRPARRHRLGASSICRTIGRCAPCRYRRAAHGGRQGRPLPLHRAERRAMPAATTCTPPCCSGPACSWPSRPSRACLPGRVRLIFQPAEEAAGGALDVLAAGGIASVGRIFALHCDPRLDAGQLGVRSGAITAACDRIEVRVSGPGGHTARPHLTATWSTRSARSSPRFPRHCPGGSTRGPA